ncbi:HNH endonuclease signature motif containing protein [Marinobacterium stanieri]|uniref:Uncharacterized protein n=1 Tax=Marinobacterium stanieri TaxID=49186 RepID=A0A1N6XAT0_9GAMM|nr:HNH endonuclease [Marinobacterium stanieri]SIQ99452.1 hypothetical protein SAMN05421647_11355 [Marinobacterium stanieri]
MSSVLGNWSAPITGVDVAELQRVIESFDHRCQYCGFQTYLTAQVPLGHFHVVVRDKRLHSEPANWVPLCDMCVDFNQLDLLEGKGMFIEAPWISQGRLNNVVRTCYAMTLSSGTEWGDMAQAADRLLRAIDCPPKQWSEMDWKGEPNILQEVLEKAPYAFPKSAYLSKLRVRLDRAPYEEAIRYWINPIERSWFASEYASNSGTTQSR